MTVVQLMEFYENHKFKTEKHLPGANGISLLYVQCFSQINQGLGIGKNVLKKIEWWHERGGPNVLGYKYLLNAELVSLGIKNHIAAYHYAEYIVWAAEWDY